MIGNGAYPILLFIAVHVPNKSVILPDKKVLHEAREKLILFSHCYIKLAFLLEKKLLLLPFHNSVLSFPELIQPDRARQICHVPGLFLKQNVLRKFLNSKKRVLFYFFYCVKVLHGNSGYAQFGRLLYVRWDFVNDRSGVLQCS